MPKRDAAMARSIKAASQRLLAGVPEVVKEGRLSVSALAEEARVPRNWLNREYEQEAEEHRLAVVAAQQPGEPTTIRERELLAQVATLTDQVAALREQKDELTQSKDSWKTAAEHFVRLAHVKQVQLNRLRSTVEVAKNNRDRHKAELDDAISRAEQAELELMQYEASRPRPSLRSVRTDPPVE